MFKAPELEKLTIWNQGRANARTRLNEWEEGQSPTRTVRGDRAKAVIDIIKSGKYTSINDIYKQTTVSPSTIKKIAANEGLELQYRKRGANKKRHAYVVKENICYAKADGTVHEYLAYIVRWRNNGDQGSKLFSEVKYGERAKEIALALADKLEKQFKEQQDYELAHEKYCRRVANG